MILLYHRPACMVAGIFFPIFTIFLLSFLLIPYVGYKSTDYRFQLPGTICITHLLTLSLRLQLPRECTTITPARDRCKRAERGLLDTVTSGVVHWAAKVSARDKRLNAVVPRII